MVNDDRSSDRRPSPASARPKAKPDQEPAFVPPDEIKDSEETIPSTKAASTKKSPSKIAQFHPIKVLDKWWRQRERWQQILLAGASLFILISGGLAVYAATRPSLPQPPDPQKAAPAPKPTTEASKLSGRLVDPDINKRPVIGVMIENSPDARPQSGLRDAGVVYEAIAEGGITRFLALFQDRTPKYIGPIRSARPYYVRWALPFDAPYAHVGGSPNALRDIRSLHVKDLDQFYNAGSYDRVSNRYAPHNVYSGVERLMSLAKSKGWNSSDFTGFARKEAKPRKVPKVKSIHIDISGFYYNVDYSYNAASNSYNRREGGQKHTDEKSRKQISPDVVVVLVTQQSLESDGLHTTYKTSGGGTAFVFQDGGVTRGKWSKKNEKGQIKFTTAEGQPLLLNPGQTWITVVGASSAVSFK